VKGITFFKYALCVEPEAAVNDCWAQGAVPKVIASPRKSLAQQDIDVLASGDASISAASLRPLSQSQSVFTVTALCSVRLLQSTILTVFLVDLS